MKTKLWQKTQHSLNSLVEQFETGDDLILDQQLLQADVYGSIAHATMLQSINLLTVTQLQEIKTALSEVLKLNEAGEFTLSFGDEDIHTKIENYITEKYPQAGKSIHTGRSRNDQVLVDLRLFAKEQILQIEAKQLQLISTLLTFAKQHKEVIMPGYTHMQKAMPSSVGMWAGAYVESLLDSYTVMQTAYELNDQSPLGSGAAYGVALPLNREMTAKLLGFAKVQNNSLYCQNSRGKIESAIVFACLHNLMDISKLASDVLLFTTAEFNFLKVDRSLCTGSSIMPQKQNVDIAELLRSKVHVLNGYFQQIQSIVINLPSGYNRDFQDTKKPFFAALELTAQVLEIATILMQNITPNTEVLAKSVTPELYAATAAYEKVLQGTPFRDAYREVGDNLSALNDYDISKSQTLNTHSGSLGNLQLEKIDQIVEKLQSELEHKTQRYHSTLRRLLL